MLKPSHYLCPRFVNRSWVFTNPKSLFPDSSQKRLKEKVTKTFLNCCRSYICKSRLWIDKFITIIQKWLQHWHLIWKKTYCAADGGRLARTCWAPAFEISLWTAAVSAVRATPCVENNIRIIIKLNNSSSLTTLFTSKFIQDKQRWPNFLMFVNPALSLNFCLFWWAPFILLRTDIAQSPTLPPASCQCVH